MDLINLIAIAVGLAAAAVLCFDVCDAWFFCLLAMACLLGGVSEAFKDHQLTVLGFLLAGTFFAGASLRAVFAVRRGRKGDA